MTVFRVNIKRDRAAVVKLFGKKDRELVKITEDWNDGCGKYAYMIEHLGKDVIKRSRKVYAAADKRIKELSKNKKNIDDVATLLNLRKTSYDMTMALKKLGVSIMISS